RAPAGPCVRVSLLLLCQRRDERAEDVTAVLVALELVEARAGGREQHDVTGSGRAAGRRDGRTEGAAVLVRDAGVGERRRDLVRGGADQVGAVVLIERACERLVALVLAETAENDV